MAWMWRFETSEREPMDIPTVGEPTFPAQGDAESWLGEAWRDLAEAGVAQVTLFENDREVYGPMSLSPAEE
jgi:hypothetical protein